MTLTKAQLVDSIQKDYLYSSKGEMAPVSKLMAGDLDAESYNIILRRSDDIDRITNENLANAYTFFSNKIVNLTSHRNKFLID